MHIVQLGPAMSYSGGYDGNSSSKGSENKLSFEVSAKPHLDGSASCQQQCRVLASMNREEDLTFRENSIQDVTDKGRNKAACSLQKVLEQLLGASAVQTPDKTTHIENGILKRKAASAFAPGSSPATSSTAPGSAPASKGAAPAAESQMRQEVRQDLAELQTIRLAGGGRTNDAIETMKRLNTQHMTSSCLKITKIAAEVNQGFWRENQLKVIRELAQDLVQGWRSLYREDAGISAPVAPTRIGSQRLRTTSMFLEQSCYTHFQKATQYQALIGDIAERLLEDPVLAKDVAVGGISAADFIKKVVDRRRLTKAEQGISKLAS